MKKNAILILLIFFLSSVVYADVIYLKNGNRLEGRIVAKNKTSVVIEMAFGKISISKKDILRIIRASGLKTAITQSERLIHLGAEEHAVAYLEKLLPKYGKKKVFREALAEAYIAAGKGYLQENQYHLAENSFRISQRYSSRYDLEEDFQNIQRQKEKATEYQKQADLAWSGGNTSEALRLYLLTIENYPAFAEEVGKNLSQSALEEGNQNLRKERFDRAVFFYDLCLEYTPEFFALIEQRWLYSKVQYISQSFLQQENWTEATKSLEEVLEASPSYAPALFLLGLSWERQQDLSQAFYYYQKVLGKENLWRGSSEQLEKVRILAQEKLGIRSPSIEQPHRLEAKASGKWEKLRSPHFEVLHQNKKIGKKVLDSLEHHWKKIQLRLAPQPWKAKWLQMCQVHVHPNKESYVLHTRMPSWSEGVALVRYSGGRLRSHNIHLYMNAPLLTSAILPHELTHVMYPWFLDYEVRLPLWLSEGVAMLNEPDFRQRSRMRIVRNAFNKGEAFSLQDLVSLNSYPEDDKKVSIFYGQSFSVAKYLLDKGGAAKLKRFSENLSRGVPRALAIVYSIRSVSDFEKEWQSYVRKQN